MSKLYLIGILLVIFGLFACDDALFDAGSETSHEIVFKEAFSIIRFNNIFEVTIIQDTINKVIFTCGENLQSKVSTQIINGKLILDHSEKSNWSRKYKHIKAEIHLITSMYFEIIAPVNLKTIGILRGKNFILKDYSGVSEFDVNLDVENCNIAIVYDSYGFFKIKGNCINTYIEDYGSAVIRADSLQTINCKVKHLGFADLYVNASKKLNVSLEYTGNVYYTGNPSEIVIEKKLSTGNLIRVK